MSSGSFYDIFSWWGHAVLRFSVGEGKGQSCEISRWPSLTPSRLFLSHNPLFQPVRIVPPVLFPATAQWKHGAVVAEQNTVWFSVSLSLWLIDSVRLLDNSDNTIICVCLWLCCGQIWVCEHALSHFVRGFILCWMSVCVTVLCLLQGGPSLLKAGAQSFTPGLTQTSTEFCYRQAAGMKNHKYVAYAEREEILSFE